MLKVVSFLFLLSLAPLKSDESPEAIVEEVFDLLKKSAEQDYIGEGVSQLDHALQAAALADQEEERDDELTLAALFHDVGHQLEGEQMEDLGRKDHEKVGAEYILKKGFSARIANLIRGHTEAKRYLCTEDPSYYTKLSPASQKTLLHQGGFMEGTDLCEFTEDPDFKCKIKIRRFDEAAKVCGKIVPELETYRQRAIKHLKEQQSRDT